MTDVKCHFDKCGEEAACSEPTLSISRDGPAIRCFLSVYVVDNDAVKEFVLFGRNLYVDF